GLKIVHDREGNRAKKRDGKWRQAGDSDGQYTLQTTPETPEAFYKRVLAAIAEDPDRYYQRSNPVRLHDERSESDFDVWSTATQILQSKTFDMWPRNPDSCMQWGRACDY